MKERKSVTIAGLGYYCGNERRKRWTWVYMGELQFPLPVLCASTKFPRARAEALDCKETETHEHRP